MEQIKRYKAVITGNVQGVGLRVFVVDNASKLGITGWVKKYGRWNCRNGSTRQSR